MRIGHCTQAFERYACIFNVCGAGCIENDVFLASVIWPCIALLWEGVGEFLNGFNLDKYYMILYGYIAVAILQTLIKEIVEVFLLNNQCNTENNPEGAGPCNELLRVFVEDIYIAMTTTAVILIWKGQSLHAFACVCLFVLQPFEISRCRHKLGRVAAFRCSAVRGDLTRNSAIANRSRVSCAHNTSKASIPTSGP